MLARRALAGVVGRSVKEFQARAAFPVAGGRACPPGFWALPARRSFSTKNDDERTYADMCKTVAADAVLQGLIGTTAGSIQILCVALFLPFFGSRGRDPAKIVLTHYLFAC